MKIIKPTCHFKINKFNLNLGREYLLKSASSPILPILCLSLGLPITLRRPTSPPATVANPVEVRPIPVTHESVPFIVPVFDIYLSLLYFAIVLKLELIFHFPYVIN